MKKVNSISEFLEYTLRKNQFKCVKDEANCRVYINKANEEYIEYSSKDKYYLGIANYKVAKDFNISFTNPSKIFKFGIVFDGTTSFKINDVEGHFTPSAYFTFEEGIKGIQKFSEGSHHHGMEITIFKDYLDEVCKKFDCPCIDNFNLKVNTPYPYLPKEVVIQLQKILSLHNNGLLNPMRLEANILDCLGIFFHEFMNNKEQKNKSISTSTIINIGNRKVSLTDKDIKAIEKAYEILTKRMNEPITILELSDMVYLNEQKLKAGFKAIYKLTIHQYTTSLRMSVAANLLTTTNLKLSEIANYIGYYHTNNFIAAFKKFYKETPSKFRAKLNTDNAR